ncbi:hypothetical protein Slin14017_G086470 [Septoria linicola]|nr:hypothetical protein Slin14017_G086470 [Septoria linicola]
MANAATTDQPDPWHYKPAQATFTQWLTETALACGHAARDPKPGKVENNLSNRSYNRLKTHKLKRLANIVAAHQPSVQVPRKQIAILAYVITRRQAAQEWHARQPAHTENDEGHAHFTSALQEISELLQPLVTTETPQKSVMPQTEIGQTAEPAQPANIFDGLELENLSDWSDGAEASESESESTITVAKSEMVKNQQAAAKAQRKARAAKLQKQRRSTGRGHPPGGYTSDGDLPDDQDGENAKIHSESSETSIKSESESDLGIQWCWSLIWKMCLLLVCLVALWLRICVEDGSADTVAQEGSPVSTPDSPSSQRQWTLEQQQQLFESLSQHHGYTRSSIPELPKTSTSWRSVLILAISVATFAAIIYLCRVTITWLQRPRTRPVSEQQRLRPICISLTPIRCWIIKTSPVYRELWTLCSIQPSMRRTRRDLLRFVSGGTVCNNPLCHHYVQDLYSLLVLLGLYGDVGDIELHGKYYLE